MSQPGARSLTPQVINADVTRWHRVTYITNGLGTQHTSGRIARHSQSRDSRMVSHPLDSQALYESSAGRPIGQKHSS
jgi:hypothetical protein